MNTDYIKTKAYGIEAAYQVDASRKHAKQLIKGLSQKQRKLLIHILQNPEARVDEAVLKQLNRALTTPKSRNKGLSVKISRAWKNRFNDRVKSSSVFAALSSNKSKPSTVTPPAILPLRLKASPPKNPPIDLKWQLDVLKSNKFRLKELTSFLALNAKELATFAFKKPNEWTSFSKKIQGKISCKKTNRLFINLNRCINLACVKSQRPGFNPCFPREIVDLIALKLPAGCFFEQSLFAMQMLYRANIEAKCLLGSIPPEILANWKKERNISWRSLDLSFEDLKELTEYCDEFELPYIKGFSTRKSTDVGSEESPLFSISKTQDIRIRHEASKEDLNYLTLFKNLNDVTFYHVPRGGEKLFKNLTHLKKVGFYNTAISDDFLKSCSFLPDLTLYNCTGYTQTGINYLTNLSDLTYGKTKAPKEEWEAIERLPRLTSLYLQSKISSLKGFKNLKSLDLAYSSLKNIMSLLKLPKLKNLTIQALDAFEIPPLKHLKELVISIRGDLSATAMQNIKKMPCLHTLTIIAKKLPLVEFNRNLKSLTLVCEPIKNLDSIHKLSNLENLTLRFSIKDQELKSLQSMSNLKVISWTNGIWLRK